MEDKRQSLPKGYEITIGRQYTIDSVLAYGGSCIVYKGHYQTSDNIFKHVLIKEIYPKELKDSIDRTGRGPLLIKEDVKTRFDAYVNMAKSENDVIDKLRGKDNNDYFFERFDTYGLNNTLYTVIETRSGHMLSHIIKENEESDDNIKPHYNDLHDIVKFALRICECTRELHKNNYLHLDLHPGNIHISTIQTGEYSGNRVARLIDFNSAKHANSLNHEEQVFTYSEGYSSDELIKRCQRQLAGSAVLQIPISFASDIFSIGAIIYRMLQCRPLDQQVSPPENSSPKKIQITHENRFCRSCSVIVLNKLNEILWKCLNRLHSHRYQCIDELMRELLKLSDMIENKPCMEDWYAFGQSAEVFKAFENQLMAEMNFNKKLIPDVKYDNKAKDFLTAISIIGNNKSPHILLSGEGGCGKTTLLKHSCFRLTCSGSLSKIPFYISLNRIFDDEAREDYTIINEILNTYFNIKNPSETDYRNLEALFNCRESSSTRRFLLFVDGLNEIVSGTKRDEVLKQIRHITGFSNLQIVLANRSFIYEFAAETEFCPVEIIPLTADKINLYLNEHNVPGITNPNLIKVLSSPLMLNNYASTFEHNKTHWDREPESEADVLDFYISWCMENLVTKHWRSDKIRNSVRTVFDEVLGSFMFYMSRECRLFITRKEFVRFIQNLGLPEDTFTPEECIGHICDNTGFISLDTETGSYFIMHQIYRDFIAATYVIDQMWKCCPNSEVPEILQDRALPWEVMKYVGDILKEKNNLVKTPFDTYLSSEYINIINSLDKDSSNSIYKNAPNALITWQLRVCSQPKNRREAGASTAVYNLLEILWIARGAISEKERAALKLKEFRTTLIDKNQFPHYKKIRQLLGYGSTLRAASGAMALLFAAALCFYLAVPTPKLELQKPDSSVITEGTTRTYLFRAVSGSKVLTDIDFSPQWFEMIGFDGEISAGKYSKDGTYYLKLDNIRENQVKKAGEQKYLQLKGSKFWDLPLKKNKTVKLDAFTLLPQSAHIYAKISGGFKEVKQGTFTEYKVEFTSKEDFEVDLTGDMIETQGFQADITIERTIYEKNRVQYILHFSNIKGDVNNDCSFSILEKAAKGASGSLSYKASSKSFKLVGYNVDMNPVTYKVSGPSEKQITNGGAVSYTIKFDSPGSFRINLDKSYISPEGFTADIDVENGSSRDERRILLSNIICRHGEKISIYFKEGMAETFNGSLSDSLKLDPSFEIVEDGLDKTPPEVYFQPDSINTPVQNSPVSYIYTLIVNDDHTLGRLNISEKDIELKGFNAKIFISRLGSSPQDKSSRVSIHLSDIQGEPGENKYITIKKGSIKDASGNTPKDMVLSPAFTLKAEEYEDKPIEGPRMILSTPSVSGVKTGGRVEFKVQFFNSNGDSHKDIDIYLRPGSIVLNGFTAKKEIRTGANPNERIIVLSNIEAQEGSRDLKTISITGGVAIDNEGNLSPSLMSSEPFRIIE